MPLWPLVLEAEHAGGFLCSVSGGALASKLRSLVPAAQSIAGAALSLLWPFPFCWTYGKEHDEQRLPRPTQSDLMPFVAVVEAVSSFPHASEIPLWM